MSKLRVATMLWCLAISQVATAQPVPPTFQFPPRPVEQRNYYYSDKHYGCPFPPRCGPYTGSLAIPTGYTWSGDPFLAESQQDSGQSPRRVYSTGLIGNDAGATAVAVWYSDNLGQGW